MIRQVEVNSQNIESLKQLKLEAGEAVMFVKFVLLKQDTLSNGQALSKIEAAPAALLLGDADEISATLSIWLSEAIKNYKGI